MSLRRPKLNIEWIRVEAGYFDLPEIIHDKKTGMISFIGIHRERINVYVTTGTIVIQPKYGSWTVTKNNSFEDVISTMSKLSRF
jgi:hypothetical protein